jgi:predicted dehydrogenase
VTQIGFLGVSHIHTPDFVNRLTKRTDCAVRWVWDPDANLARQTADRLSANVATDAQQVVLDPDVRAVLICSQTLLHQELALLAAGAGKHLFVEKPLGMTWDDANRIANAVREAGVIFQTGYHNRSWPPTIYLKDLVSSGKLGKITRARASVCHGGALHGWFDSDYRWMADLRQAGVGAFGDLGTHGLDTLLWLFGEVQGVFGLFGSGTSRYPGCEELGEALIRFRSGVIATLAASWDDRDNPVSYLVSGTVGHVSVIHDQVYMREASTPADKVQTPVTTLPRGHKHPFELFFDALGGENVPLTTVTEAAERVRVMDAIYQSARDGRWVEL